MDHIPFIRVGKRILNLHSVQWVEVESKGLIRVYLEGRDSPMEFSEGDAEDLLKLFESGYAEKISRAHASEGIKALHELETMLEQEKK